MGSFSCNMVAFCCQNIITIQNQANYAFFHKAHHLFPITQESIEFTKVLPPIFLANRTKFYIVLCKLIHSKCKKYPFFWRKKCIFEFCVYRSAMHYAEYFQKCAATISRCGLGRDSAIAINPSFICDWKSAIMRCANRTDTANIGGSKKDVVPK